MRVRKEYKEKLNEIIDSLINSPITISCLREKYLRIKELNERYAKRVENQDWSPSRYWRDNPRKIKFIREEVFPTLIFFEQYDNEAIVRFYNDNRNYDVELLDVNGNVVSYIEVTYPHDGEVENEINKTVNKNGGWTSLYSDGNPADSLRPKILSVIEKKSNKDYPNNTSLLIMSGTHCPTSDDFDDSSPDINVEKSLDQTVSLAKKIENNFDNIWFIDRHPPHRMRIIKSKK